MYAFYSGIPIGPRANGAPASGRDEPGLPMCTPIPRFPTVVPQAVRHPVCLRPKRRRHQATCFCLAFAARSTDTSGGRSSWFSRNVARMSWSRPAGSNKKSSRQNRSRRQGPVGYINLNSVSTQGTWCTAKLMVSARPGPLFLLNHLVLARWPGIPTDIMR